MQCASWCFARIRLVYEFNMTPYMAMDSTWLPRDPSNPELSQNFLRKQVFHHFRLAITLRIQSRVTLAGTKLRDLKV